MCSTATIFAGTRVIIRAPLSAAGIATINLIENQSSCLQMNRRTVGRDSSENVGIMCNYAIERGSNIWRFFGCPLNLKPRPSGLASQREHASPTMEAFLTSMVSVSARVALLGGCFWSGGRRPKLKANQRTEIAATVISGRKTAAEAARLFSVHPSPLIYSHVTPYGTFRLDMSQRLAIEQDPVAA